jgi:choline-phosphate cytidylyltransferase
MDGIFDLYHAGHVDAIQKCKDLTFGGDVIIGVIGDKDAKGYKRKPFYPEKDRCLLLSKNRDVDQVICPAPLVVTEEFMNTHNIDLVVHGFADDADFEKQKEFFKDPIRLHKFQRIGYSHKTSTTEIIHNIKSRG